MDAERKGEASASAMERLAICPGSLNLIRAVDPPDKSTPWSESGTRIHSWVVAKLRGYVTPELTKSEQDLAETCLRQILEVAELANEVLPKSARRSDRMLETERRLWGQTPSGNRFSGQFDVAIVDRVTQSAIIIDMKTGWLEVEPAEANLQLATLAILCRKSFGIWIDHMVVAIIQPNIGQPSASYYNRDALSKAEQRILQIVDGANAKGAPINPHPDACKYCPVKLNCPQLMESVEKLATGEIPSDFGAALDLCAEAELVISELRTKAKERLSNDPNSIHGWYLQPGGMSVSVTNVTDAFKAVSDVVTKEQFLGCCDPALGKLASAYAEASKIALKDARKALYERLDTAGVISRSPKAPSLKKGTPKAKTDTKNNE